MKDPLARSLEKIRYKKKDSHNQRTGIQYTPITRQGVRSKRERENGYTNAAQKKASSLRDTHGNIHSHISPTPSIERAIQRPALVFSLSSPLYSISPPRSAPHPSARQPSRPTLLLQLTISQSPFPPPPGSLAANPADTS